MGLVIIFIQMFMSVNYKIVKYMPNMKEMPVAGEKAEVKLESAKVGEESKETKRKMNW